MSKNTNPLIMLSLVGIGLSSCEVKCNVGSSRDESKSQSSTVTEKNGVTLTNNISLDAVDVKVSKATLLLGNDMPVPGDNTISMGEKINLVLSIDTGWVVRDGKTRIGATEKITTDAGRVVLNTEDLFRDYDSTGVDPIDAKTITLSAKVGTEVGKIEHYIVDFRVWDKLGTGTITGSYKFYIRH